MGGRILEMSDHVLKDQLWAEVRREDTENMKINTPPESGSTDYRDQEFVNGESGRGQERNLRGTEWEMRVCVGWATPWTYLVPLPQLLRQKEKQRQGNQGDDGEGQ